MIEESGKILFYRNKILSMNMGKYLDDRNKVFINSLSDMSDLYVFPRPRQAAQDPAGSNNIILHLLLIPQAFH